MKKNLFEKIVTISGAVVMAVFALTSCEGKKSGGSGSSKTKKLYVGVGNSYKPYCYIDENGKPVGYELEVLKAIDELLPEYEFEFEATEFASLFSSLSQKKYDVIAQQIEYNPDRAEKYEFTKETYTTFVTYITVPESVSGISSLEDLAGKTAVESPGDNGIWYLEQFNKNHPGKEIKIDIIKVSTDESVAGLNSGRWDFAVRTKRDVEELNEKYNAHLKVVGEPIQQSSTYFLFQKGNVELRDAFDNAIRQLKSSGKLRQISIDVIGGDYTESE